MHKQRYVAIGRGSTSWDRQTDGPSGTKGADRCIKGNRFAKKSGAEPNHEVLYTSL